MEPTWTQLYVELGLGEYERIASALEALPGLQATLGVHLCPTCGDLHLPDRICRLGCAVGLGPDLDCGTVA